jgi:hypothetical protein
MWVSGVWALEPWIVSGRVIVVKKIELKILRESSTVKNYLMGNQLWEVGSSFGIGLGLFFFFWPELFFFFSNTHLNVHHLYKKNTKMVQKIWALYSRVRWSLRKWEGSRWIQRPRVTGTIEGLRLLDGSHAHREGAEVNNWSLPQKLCLAPRNWHSW